LNRKLELRVQTCGKKFELQQIKEEQIMTMLDKANEEVEKSKLEQEAYSILVNKIIYLIKIFLILSYSKAKTKENETNKTKERMQEEGQKLIELENRLENYRTKSKERVNEVQEQ
jgi:hypothetical protein